jgi:hypothetical protein
MDVIGTVLNNVLIWQLMLRQNQSVLKYVIVMSSFLNQLKQQKMMKTPKKRKNLIRMIRHTLMEVLIKLEASHLTIQNSQLQMLGLPLQEENLHHQVVQLKKENMDLELLKEALPHFWRYKISYLISYYIVD